MPQGHRDELSLFVTLITSDSRFALPPATSNRAFAGRMHTCIVVRYIAYAKCQTSSRQKAGKGCQRNCGGKQRYKGAVYRQLVVVHWGSTSTGTGPSACKVTPASRGRINHPMKHFTHQMLNKTAYEKQRSVTVLRAPHITEQCPKRVCLLVCVYASM